MNGRRARAQRIAQHAKMAADLAAMNGATPVLVGTAGGQDAYTVGPALVVVPVLRDDYPAPLKTAIDRRRRAGLTGTCDCGARRRVVRLRLQFDHERDCDAADDRLEQIANAFGMTMGRSPLADAQ